MLYRKSGIILPKTHTEYYEIKKDLSRTIRNFDGSSSKIDFYTKVDNSDDILIPRYYPVKDLVTDLSEAGDDIDIESNIVPRNERQQLSIDFLNNNTNGILCLEPASGKTVISISSISYYKKRTIIVAHKDKLLDQWVSELLNFTNIKKEEILRLTGKNYTNINKYKIIMCTPQTVSYAANVNNIEFLDSLKNSGIGMMIVDETHVATGPEKFSLTSLNINCKLTFGLSATPYRFNNTDIMNFHLGEVKYFPPEQDEMLKPYILMVYFPYNIFSKHKKYIMWGGKFNLAKYLQQSYKSTEYITTILKYLKKAYDSQRNIFILGSRINTLLELAEKSEIKKEDIGFFTPGSQNKKYKKRSNELSDTNDLDIAFKEKRIVFSTFGAGRDGSNREDLDCLLLIDPCSNIIQAIGRIMRPFPNKKQPLVIDFVDTDGPIEFVYEDDIKKKVSKFIKLADQRKEIYKKNEWQVKEVFL